MNIETLNLNHTMYELQEGLIAYENAFVILRYYNKYGYTEHFRELIGEESLVDQAKEAISKFISWLKEKLHDLVKKLFVWIEKRRVGVMKLLRKSNEPTKLPYNLERIDGYRANIFNHLPIPINFKQYSNDPAAVRENMKATFERWKSVFTKTDKFEYGSDTILKITGDMQSKVELWSDRVKTIADAMQQYERSLKESLSPEDLYRLTKEFTSKCKHIIDYNCGYSDLVNDNPEQAHLIMKEHTTQVIQLITSGCDFITKMCNVAADWYCDVKHIYDATSKDVNASIPFDRSMVHRLEAHYGGQLKVRDLILTNTSPSTWPIVKGVVHSRTAAWCYASDSNRDTFDLWINITYLNSTWSRILDALVDPNTTSGRYRKEDVFINNVVHECYHLYAAQNNLPFDQIHDPNKDRDAYHNAKHERDARDSARSFNITDSDRAWARKVLNSMIKLTEN